MKKQKLKKGLALFLTAALTLGVVPTLPGSAENIKAAEGPWVWDFATQDELMSVFDVDGYDDTVGRIVFGKDEHGKPQEWYIAGKDGAVEGDNITIFAASPLKAKQQYSSSTSDKEYKKEWNCIYEGTEPSTVSPVHYGGSDLRTTLKSMEKDTKYFSSVEQEMMNETLFDVRDYGSSNGNNEYRVSDKLYALSAEYDMQDAWLGSNDYSKGVDGEYTKGSGAIWSCTPFYSSRDAVSVVEYDEDNQGECVNTEKINEYCAVQPALNIDLSSVLFASDVPTGNTTCSGKTDEIYAMTLRFNGEGKAIGNAIYNNDYVIAENANGVDNATLVVQGNGWYYKKALNGRTSISMEEIKTAVDTEDENSLENCKIWVEAERDGKLLANMAKKGTIQPVGEIVINDIIEPKGGAVFDTQAVCVAEGITTTTPTVTYAKEKDPVVGEKAEWNTTYIVSVTLGIDMEKNYVFANEISATINNNSATPVKNADGTLTLSCEFITSKKKITKIAAPSLPSNNTFAGYYTKDDVLVTKELGTATNVTFEDNTTISMPVTWTLPGDAYNAAPGAENQFQWTINSAAYNDIYDLNNCSPTGTVTITNKSASPITVTGTDATVNYTGEAIDVSQYFTIGDNAGEATYSLVNGDGVGTGEGTLAGTVLTVMKTGTFVIRLNTAATGIYGAAEAKCTLTVGEGVMEINATDYSGAYDGQPHGITVTVANAENTTITYSTDGTTYSTNNPQYTDAGTYTVYYKIEKPNHTTVTGSKTVTIHKKDLTITAADQNLVWGTEVDKSKYTVAEGALIAGHQVSQVTLTSSTTEFTDNGIVAANDAKIVNAEGKDVTANYNISYVNGKLVIKHNTILAPTELTVAKTTTAYTAGAALTVNDLTVKVTYPDGYVETVTDYKTNADGIDMTKAGDKTLTVSLTRNGKTLTKDIRITVSPAPVIKYNVIVNGGTGDGEYQAGQTVTITADAAPKGKQFKGWVIVSGGITLAGSTSATTTFRMPGNIVEVTAAYEDVKEEKPAEDEDGKKTTADEDKKKDTTTVEVEIPKTGVQVTVPVVLAKGTTFVDAGKKATYKVMGDGSVEYVKPVKKNAKTVTIPSTVIVNGVNCKVTGIAANAFKNNKKITKVEIGSNVKSIGNNAFYGCKKLRNLTIGKNVTNIGRKAFSNCTGLIDVTIPSRVSKIGEQAFSGCKNVKIITIKTRKLNKKSVGNKAFKGVNKSIVFRVPSGKTKEYGSFLKR